MTTKERLLKAAARVFLEKGFWSATVAEICERAHTNIAAVNYHFGSKENLYKETWRHCFHRSLAAHPPDGGVAASAPAADRLRGRIRAMLGRVLDDDCGEFELMAMEMANPTGLLAELVHTAVRPLREQFERLVSELAGEAVPPPAARQCARCAMAPCILLGQMRRMHRKLRLLGAAGADAPPHPPPHEVPSIDELTEHMVRFSLGGVAAVRAHYEALVSPARRQRGDHAG
jgi:AcrR family transcriptional regulator